MKHDSSEFAVMASYILEHVDHATLSVLVDTRTGPTWLEVLTEVAAGDISPLDCDVAGVAHPIVIRHDCITRVQMLTRVYQELRQWREAIEGGRVKWN